jgi:ATP phosphoribosyltransferase
MSRRYLNQLERQGYSFRKIYVKGSCEEMFLNNLCDLLIDIVLTGNSAKEAGLSVYDKIFSSDIVLIRGKNEI